jgi:molybdate transport system ATP-binding protein
LQINVKKYLGDKRREGFFLDIAFAVENGITVLVGASGSGKTTTLRLIAGILEPDEGIIKVGSQIYFDSSRKINLSIQNRRVGYVFQQYALFPHLNAAQNIAYGIKSGANKDHKLEKANELLALFRLDHLQKRLPREMSGGEQQRVALARALASDPSVVLLDEPLSAVDAGTRANLLDEIELAQDRSRIPFIYVTHNEAEAARLGNQQITLEKGRVV